MSKELSTKRQTFCEEYVINLGNATQAALKAGYSKATAAQQGANLLKIDEIQKEIKRLKDKLNMSFEFSIGQIINEYVQMIEYAKELNGKGNIRSETMWMNAVGQLTKIFGYEKNTLDITSKGEQIKINYIVPKNPHRFGSEDEYNKE